MNISGYELEFDTTQQKFRIKKAINVEVENLLYFKTNETWPYYNLIGKYYQHIWRPNFAFHLNSD